MKVRFRNPPINEVVIGSYFEPPLVALRSEHIGLLWSRLRDEFPVVEQREPLDTAGDKRMVLTISNEFFVMPRFWFVSKDEVNLIQVQKGAFFLNWRRRKTEYPHFEEHLKPCFDRYYGVFEKFLEEDVGAPGPGIHRCELTYVNVIEPCEYWRGPQDTPRLIPSFAIPDCGPAHGAASAFSCAYRHELEPGLQLHIAIRTVEATGGPGSPRLVLEFKALGPPDGIAKSDVDAWYQQAHDVLVARFLSMTDEKIRHTYWIPEEETE